MSYLLDDVARLVASPIPRREALRRFGGALGVGILGTLGVKQASGSGMSERNDSMRKHLLPTRPNVLHDRLKAFLCHER